MVKHHCPADCYRRTNRRATAVTKSLRYHPTAQCGAKAEKSVEQVEKNHQWKTQQSQTLTRDILRWKFVHIRGASHVDSIRAVGYLPGKRWHSRAFLQPTHCFSHHAPVVRSGLCALPKVRWECRPHRVWKRPCFAQNAVRLPAGSSTYQNEEKK